MSVVSVKKCIVNPQKSQEDEVIVTINNFLEGHVGSTSFASSQKDTSDCTGGDVFEDQARVNSKDSV